MQNEMYMMIHVNLKYINSKLIV